MTNDIKLTITSLFKGEGFTKAANATKGLSKTVKDAGGAMKDLTGELGQMGGTLGKAAGGIQKLMGALAGGPMGIAIAGITAIVSALVAWKNHVDEVRQRQKEMIEHMREGYARDLYDAIERARKKQAEFLDEIIKKGQNAIARLSALRQLAKEMSGAQKGREDAQRNLDAATTEGNYLAARNNASDEFGKRRVDLQSRRTKLTSDRAQADADYAHKTKELTADQEKMRATIANLRSAIVEETNAARKEGEETDRKIQAAKDEQNDLTSKMRSLARQNGDGSKNSEIFAIQDKIKAKEKEILDLTDQRNNKEKAQLERNEKNMQEIADTEARIKAIDTQRETDYLNYQTRMQKLLNEQLKLRGDETQLENDIKKAKEEEAAAAKRKAEEEAKAAIEARNRRLREQASADEKKVRKDAENQANNLQGRMGRIQNAIRAFDERQQAGIEADHQKHNGLFGPYKYHLDKNGRIASVADALRADRYANAGTEEQNKAEHRRRADDNKAERLSKRRIETLSKSERKWLDKYNEMRGREKADKQLENLQKQKDQAVIDMKKAVEKIREDLATAVKAN